MAFHLCSYWPAADAVEINHGEKGILVGLKAAKTVCERDRLLLLYCSNECASSIRRLAIFTSQSCLEEMCSDGAISLSPERLHSMARAHWLIEWPPPLCTFDPLHQDRSTMTSYSVYYCYLLAEGQRLTLDFMPLLFLILLFMQLQAQLFFGAESVFCCTRFGHRKALVCVWWTTNAWVLLLLLQQFHHLLRAPESSVVMQQHSWLRTRWWREWRRRLLLLWSAVDPFKLNVLVSLRRERERESSTIECIQISSLPNLSLSRRLLQIVDHRCGGSRSSSSFLSLTYLAASRLSFTARLLFLFFNNN